MRRHILLAIAALFLAVAARAGVTVLSEKQPFEERYGTVSFAGRLPDYMPDNVYVTDNVATCDVHAYDAGGNLVDNTILVWDNSYIVGQTVRYGIKGGSDGKWYRVQMRCTSDNGVKVEEDLKFMVREY